MIRQCFLAETGILFYGSLLKTIGLDFEEIFLPSFERRAQRDFAKLDSATKAEIRKHVAEVSEDPWNLKTESKPCPEFLTNANAKTFGYTETHLPIDKDGKSMLARSEALEDMIDALCPLKDQLELKWSWWFLERLPVMHRVGDESSVTWS